LRVAIDAAPLITPVGGTRRYVVELTRALAQQFPGDELHLLSDQMSWALPERLRGFSNVVAEPPRWRGLRGSWWLSGLPLELKRRRIDVFHGTDFAVPYVPLIPSVMMVHDLSPWKRDPLRPAGSGRVRERAPYLMRIATRILTPTEAIREELATTFGIPRRRITAIHLAAFDADDEPPADPGQHDETAVPAPYLLYVGARQARKNIPVLMQSWHSVRRTNPAVSLVIVGPAGGGDERMQREDGLYIFDPLPDTVVSRLLSGAAAFVYPSLYEGFGLPVLEAMKAGVPVITSLDPAITEVAGGAALQVDVTSPEALSQAILCVVASFELQLRLRDQGRQRASAFSWRRTALQTRDVYSEAIRRF